MRGQEKKAEFWVKINSISDHGMINKLYEASDAGVQIRMVVRGICCLDMAHPKARNISSVSIVGRFLEHTRAFCFHNDGNPQYYISSADWMGRNLNRRVEVTVPIYDPSIQANCAITSIFFGKTILNHEFSTLSSKTTTACFTALRLRHRKNCTVMLEICCVKDNS